MVYYHRAPGAVIHLNDDALGSHPTNLQGINSYEAAQVVSKILYHLNQFNCYIKLKMQNINMRITHVILYF